jgi:hypothetical protein
MLRNLKGPQSVSMCGCSVRMRMLLMYAFILTYFFDFVVVQRLNKRSLKYNNNNILF